jgi:hypothetical protein
MTSAGVAEALRAFLEASSEYASTAIVDELRTREFARLDTLGQIYLDYTGSGLPMSTPWSSRRTLAMP